MQKWSEIAKINTFKVISSGDIVNKTTLQFDWMRYVMI